MATNARPIRFSEEDSAILDRLGHAWGPVQPLGPTAVIREAIRRCDEAESRKTEDTKPACKEKAQ